MSRAFTKEESWEDPVIPPRAALPEGVPNYVTTRGIVLLREELAALEAERARLMADRKDEGERRRHLEIVTRRLSDLASRVASAQVIGPGEQPRDQVRFGAAVTVKSVTGEVRQLAIVGVDEADPDEGRVAFVAPIARALIGRRVGETAALRTARGEDLLEVLAIEYPAG